MFDFCKYNNNVMLANIVALQDNTFVNVSYSVNN